MTLTPAPDPSTWFNGITILGATIKSNLTNYINNLINAYNASVADPGWTALSLASGYTGSASYKIVGTRLYLDGSITRTAGAFSTTATQVATLPAAGVPLRNQGRGIVAAVSTSTVAAVQMNVAAGSQVFTLQQGPGTAGTVQLGGVYWDVA